MKFSNMNIGKRLAVSFITIIAFLVGMIVFGIYQMEQIDENMKRIVEVNNVQLKHVNTMLSSSETVSRVIRSIALLDDAKKKQEENQEIDEARATYDEAQKKLEALINSDELRKQFDEAVTLRSEAREMNNQVITLALANKKQEAITMLLDVAGPKVDAWHQGLQDMADLSENRNQLRYEEAQDSYEHAKIMMYILGSVAVLIALAFTIILTRSITKPVEELMTAMEAGALGDLTVKADIESKDELGRLAHSFNQMIYNVQKLLADVAGISEQVAASAQELSASAEETTGATEHVAAAVEQLASGAQQQAEQAAEVSATMEQLGSGIEDTTQNMQEINNLTADTNTSSMEGRKLIKQAASQMQNIKEQTDGAEHVIAGLGEKSKEIARIVDMITGIADQTNLLALNAAIEAARAGEQGRGFAVVADEVRKLAEESSKAAEEIAELIHAIGTETQKAVETMENNTQAVDSGIEITREVNDSFTHIVEDINQITAKIEEISATMEEMSAGAQQTVASVEEFSKVTQDASASTQEAASFTEEQNASMEEIASSAVKLAELAQDLQNGIAKFKV